MLGQCIAEDYLNELNMRIQSQAENCTDAQVIYNFLEANGIGQTHTTFYIAYALHMESKSKLKIANEVFNLGIARNQWMIMYKFGVLELSWLLGEANVGGFVVDDEDEGFTEDEEGANKGCYRKECIGGLVVDEEDGGFTEDEEGVKKGMLSEGMFPISVGCRRLIVEVCATGVEGLVMDDEDGGFKEDEKVANKGCYWKEYFRLVQDVAD
ncbi:hypothetical protein Syun_029218 [Stephania yunnanensis]|uniref:BUB1 N-terminal domain-containing protein n=1 Tax=Stephania yunnanensis TaxID=152371 RepID=A0AAP0E566_9MAGN